MEQQKQKTEKENNKWTSIGVTQEGLELFKSIRIKIQAFYGKELTNDEILKLIDKKLFTNKELKKELKEVS
jgi:hypothetical protein